jgi:hypothetical protein
MAVLTAGYIFREVQLKSPNWLYGQPRPEPEDQSSSKSGAKQSTEMETIKDCKTEQECDDANWLAELSPNSEKELFSR